MGQVNGRWQVRVLQTQHNFKNVQDIIAERLSEGGTYENMIYGYKKYSSGSIATLAGEEYDHAMRLHDLVTKEIAKTRKALMEKGEAVPQYMLDMWNEKHEEYIERMGKAKYELEIAKKITPKIM